MSLAEILEELPKLTLEERAEIFRHIEALDTDAEIERRREGFDRKERKLLRLRLQSQIPFRRR